MLIYCCACGAEVKARLTYGSEIYPKSRAMTEQPFWKHDLCGNYVGCHHKTKGRTKPLGTIAPPELRAARMKIHRALDPLWEGRPKEYRKDIYAKIASRLGIKFYHTAEVNSMREAEEVLLIIRDLGGSNG